MKMTTVGWVLLGIVVAGLFVWQHFSVRKVVRSSEALNDRIYSLRSRLEDRLGELEKEVRELKRSLQSSRPAEPGAEKKGYVPLQMGGSLQLGSSKD